MLYGTLSISLYQSHWMKPTTYFCNSFPKFFNWKKSKIIHKKPSNRIDPSWRIRESHKFWTFVRTDKEYSRSDDITLKIEQIDTYRMSIGHLKTILEWHYSRPTILFAFDKILLVHFRFTVWHHLNKQYKLQPEWSDQLNN